MLQTPNSRRTDCPIHIALELLGDRWTLLIVRDLLYKGLHSYKSFLGAGERIATNILSDRLQRLQQAGLVEKRPHANDARQSEYHLTEVGCELAPMLMEMVLWSATHFQTDAPPEILHRMRTDRNGFLAETRKQWELNRDGASKHFTKCE